MSDDDHQALLLSQWKESCANFDIGVGDNVTSFVNTLEAISKTLAREDEARSVNGFVRTTTSLIFLGQSSARRIF